MSIDRIFTRLLPFIIGSPLYVFLSVASAHHGFGAHFDTQQYVAIEGVVSRFEFVNPHSYVYFQAIDDAGDTADRWCELNARTQLHRKGISRTSFSAGDRIRIEGFISRKDPLGCYVASVELADGSVLTLKNGAGNSLYSARKKIDLTLCSTRLSEPVHKLSERIRECLLKMRKSG